MTVFHYKSMSLCTQHICTCVFTVCMYLHMWGCMLVQVHVYGVIYTSSGSQKIFRANANLVFSENVLVAYRLKSRLDCPESSDTPRSACF